MHGPTGISSVPDLTIIHAAANAQFGSGLTAVRWSSATRDDLVVGAPGADTHGHVFVFRGGTLTAGTRTASTADLHITASATSPGFFATGSLGRTLATADVDGNGVDDLVIAAPTGGATIGGIVVLYGDTVTGNIALSDLDAGGANGSIAELFRDPSGTPGHQLGFYLHSVGPTEGPTDITDDLVAAYVDDYNTIGDSVFVLRSDGTRPPTPGVSARTFAIGRDVRIDFAQTVYRSTEWGSQVTSIDDQNGDGSRDLVIGAYRTISDAGQVLIIDGKTVGTAGVASTADAGVVLTTITGTTKSKLGAVVWTHDKAVADIDGDGRQDLVLGGVQGTQGRAFVWFGGAIPKGATTLASAATAIDAPAGFAFTRQTPKGPAGQARWVGDLDGDGLEDVCWAAPFDNNGDEMFEVLSD
ncbi:MAG: FG-GAP repeat protein [Deltaproteobacteria bacterium]|nr:FG-GAP repeat protein [Deltaproteobacteria bacterium]